MTAEDKCGRAAFRPWTSTRRTPTGGSLLSTDEVQLTKTDTKPTVQVKSMRDGLLFLLDEQCEFNRLIEHLRDLLFGETQSVFDGPEVKIAVDYGERLLNAIESRELLKTFHQKDNFHISEWGPITEARRTLQQTRSRVQGTQHIFKGTVRAGQRFVFEGDVVVIGDVNPGGEVVATGDIYVFGKLGGIAHGGATGDTNAVIAAAEFLPMQLRIASVVGRAPEERGKSLHAFMEFAYIRENGMAVDRMQYLASRRGRSRGLVEREGEAL